MDTVSTTGNSAHFDFPGVGIRPSPVLVIDPGDDIAQEVADHAAEHARIDRGALTVHLPRAVASSAVNRHGPDESESGAVYHRGRRIATFYLRD